MLRFSHANLPWLAPQVGCQVIEGNVMNIGNMDDAMLRPVNGN
jgi:hypothetical protein